MDDGRDLPNPKSKKALEKTPQPFRRNLEEVDSDVDEDGQLFRVSLQKGYLLTQEHNRPRSTLA